jgi:hypothetical protein
VRNRFQSLPFKCDLQRYNEEAFIRELTLKSVLTLVGLYNLTHSLKGARFQPLNPSSEKTGFKPLLSSTTCTATSWLPS